MSNGCLVYGAGGFGREAAWLLRDYHMAHGEYEPLCFVDDTEALLGLRIVGLSVIDLDSAQRQYPGAAVVVAIGDPHTREIVVSKVKALGFTFPTIVHPSVMTSHYVVIGDGSLICANNVITTEVKIGKQTHINLSCTIGHDVIIGDYCTVSPGVHISGWVHIGNRVFIGTGAVFINGAQDAPLIVGDDAVIGAAACVTRSIPPGVTVVGVPAKAICKKGKV